MSLKPSLFAGIAGGIAGALLTVGFLGGAVALRPALVYNLLTDTGHTGQYPLAPQQPVAAQKKALDISDVVAKVNPAVISIVISKDVPVMEQFFTNPFGDQFPGFQIPQFRQNGTKKQEIGGGSGFLVSADGYIVTNAHVVQDKGAEYAVFTNEGKKFETKVIAVDDVLDIALIKIDGKDLPFLTFGNSNKVRLGQSVIAIGNALGEFRNTVSVGVVSGLSRSIIAGQNGGGSENLDNVIQTDAAINPGNSGGPLITLDGTVIGMNSAVANGAQNIGFSIPANTVKDAVDSMKKNGRVLHAFLGVRSTPVTAALKQKNNLSVNDGALILRGSQPDELAIMPGSPADKAGLMENDIILEIDGQRIDETHSLPSIIRGKKPHDKIVVKIQHKGEEKTVEIILGEAGTSQKK